MKWPRCVDAHCRPHKGDQKCVYLMTLTLLPFPFFALRGVSSTAQSKIAGW